MTRNEEYQSLLQELETAPPALDGTAERALRRRRRDRRLRIFGVPAGSLAACFIAFVLLVNLFLLVVGMFLEGTAALIILTPLLVPTMTALGVDPILFGIIMCVNVTMGGITPPFGTLMFLTCSIIKVSIKDFLKESWVLILTMIIGLLGITYIPQITLFLPSLLG